ncbi:FliI/YscN family ATPase [Roseobacter sp. CCS2]|uniref:FliI/YscN family ATPase n=1 Tax=Roseobacter sp. CCS2 TaxID=391593 RepID=UPI0000F4033E|nr:FliI/YscN family ATPase [Roseobacter sp. CCS2]EBA13831.1 H+-transporting two-sector ATPase, flagellum-specific [Roseobacter sp. CCS2]
MQENLLDQMRRAVDQLSYIHTAGRVIGVSAGTVHSACTQGETRVGDRATLHTAAGKRMAEVVKLDQVGAHLLVDGATDGVSINDPVVFQRAPIFAPHTGWIGRVIDPDGRPLDGQPLLPGAQNGDLNRSPPSSHERRGLGARLETGLAVFNTLLPLVRGQRVGLFAGSGVGKSTLLADLARGVQADVIVIALVGERGREVGHFVQDVLGADGMGRAVVVAATSDTGPQVRRRCALSAMVVAESFRDAGLHVLLLIDSVTRFCEAHRELAVASGESANLRGYPASTGPAIARLCERAGPGAGASGDITAVFSVLVAGSDMDEPVADMLRGVLDGHIVLDREIAERGRFPAVDVVRSVSRALPDAANEKENEIIAKARSLLGTYVRSEMMVQAGLYVSGSDPLLDAAIAAQPALEDFLTIKDTRGTMAHFAKLRQAIASSPMRPDAQAGAGF